jgi:DNA polymerase-3 subunit gamma/tau
MSLFGEDELPPAAATGGAAVAHTPHQALARKYRPRSFDELAGQEHVVRALTQALGTQRLHHAYLFTGTRGVGKTTISRIFAKALNCVGPDGKGGVTAEPCGVCSACTEIDAGRFVDYIEMDAASNRSVDEMTQVLEQAVYKPTSGRFKVYMIDEVHMLTSHAFNAMLKTLEEPPEYVKFVLATTDPQKVPVTVLSRCLQFNLKQMPREHIVNHLHGILTKESIKHSLPVLSMIAKAAAGSMRDALSLTDQAIAYCGTQLDTAQVREMLGAVDQTYLYQLLDALAARDGARLLSVADDMHSRSIALASALDDLASLLQRIAVLQVLPQSHDHQDPDAAEAVRLADALSAEDVQLFYGIALKGRQEMSLAPDPYVGFSMTLLRMLSFTADDSLSAPLPAKPVASAALVASRAPVATAKPPAAAPAASSLTAGGARADPAAAVPSPVRRVVFDGDWAAFCAGLPLSGLARELAMQSELLSHEGTQFNLRVPKPALLAAGAPEKLQAVVSQALGMTVKIMAEVGEVTSSAAIDAARAKAERQRDAEATVQNDPLVQSLLQTFGGQIVPGSVKPID